MSRPQAPVERENRSGVAMSGQASAPGPGPESLAGPARERVRRASRILVAMAWTAVVAVALLVARSDLLFQMVPQVPRFRCAPAVAGEHGAVETIAGVPIELDEVRTRTLGDTTFAVATVDGVVAIFELAGPVGDRTAAPADNAAEMVSGVTRTGPLPAARDADTYRKVRACLN